jgi:hypothetical protein
MTLAALRTRVHQSAVRLASLEAILDDLRDGEIPAPALHLPLADLAAVERRLDGLAERLGEAFDPGAVGGLSGFAQEGV